MSTWATIAQVRAMDDKLISESKISNTEVTDRIARAQVIIKSALANIISEADLDTVGSGSSVLNTLTIYKSVELCLVKKHGIMRRVDEIGDIDYFRKEYNDLLKKIMSGEIEIISGSTQYSGVSIPAVNNSTGNQSYYPNKGIPGFNDNDQIIDDEVTIP